MSIEENLLWNAASEKMTAAEYEKFFVVANGLGAKLIKDGNQWCYIYGKLPESNCIVGFGNSPEEALWNFYKEFIKTTATVKEASHD